MLRLVSKKIHERKKKKKIRVQNENLGQVEFWADLLISREPNGEARVS